MSGTHSMAKSTGRDYSAEDKLKAAGKQVFRSLGDVESEIIKLKKKIKRDAVRLDMLRAMARDFRRA